MTIHSAYRRTLLHIFFISGMLFLPAGVWLSRIHAQQVCSHAHHIESVYENPLFDRWLSDYDMKFYHIDLEVSNNNTFVSGSATLIAEALETMDTLVLQLSNLHTVSQVTVDTTETPDFEHAGDVLYIPVDVAEGERVSVKVDYSGDGGSSGFFAGISRKFDSETGEWVTYTLSEPLNALDWFPVKQVLHDKIDSVWMDFTCATGLMVGSNGLLEEIEELPDSKHKFKWKSRYPIAYYLLSLAVGNYQDYSFNAPLSNEGETVLVQNFIYNHDQYLTNYKDDIDATGDMIELFSKLVVDYPFAEEKYGHTTAPMGGGMEHQTMTTLQNFSFTLVAHELAHQWFGDDITCGTWQDIWINEGFASYFEYIALQNLVSQEAADNWLANAMYYARQETEGSVYVPEAQADNVSRVFSYALSYKKGALLLHMIRHQIDDDEVFYDVLKQYSERYSDSLATAQEFRKVLEAGSGMDFSCFFDQFYYGKGYPRFSLKWYNVEDSLVISSKQTTTSTETPLFNLYFDVELQFEDGTFETRRLYQSVNEEEFRIPVSKQVISVDFDPNDDLLATSTVRMDLPGLANIALVPNPFVNSFMVHFRNFPGSATMDVINIQGQTVMTDKITSNPYEFNTSSLPDGVYVVYISSENGAYSEKIMKSTTE